MGYRNGVYVAFHGGGTTDPTASDIKYYRIMQGWQTHKDIDFSFSNSHEKTGSVRDSSLDSTLERALKARLRDSKVLLLITSATTRFDDDWVPFEIRYGVEECGLPVIVAYPQSPPVFDSTRYRWMWPDALQKVIDNRTARTLHIPFGLKPIRDAIDTYSVHNLPPFTLTTYNEATYRNWGMWPPAPPKPVGPPVGASLGQSANRLASPTLLTGRAPPARTILTNGLGAWPPRKS